MNNTIMVGGGAVALVTIIFLSNLLMRPGSAPDLQSNATESPSQNELSVPDFFEINENPSVSATNTPLVDAPPAETIPPSETIVEREDSSLPPPPPPPPNLNDGTPAEVSVPEALTGPSWQWLDTAGALATRSATTQFVLTFNPDGSMRSTTDCNSLGGLYQTSAPTLTFGDIFSTRMYCEGSQEQAYQEQLRLVERYTIDDTTLYLSLTDGQGTMRFVAN